MLLDEGLGHLSNPYENPLRIRARTFYAHRAGEQKLIDQDLAALKSQLLEEGAYLVSVNQMREEDVAANVERALSIVRGAVNTERYREQQRDAAGKLNPREVGRPVSPARAKRQEWREELDEEEEDGNERKNKATPPRMTRTQARAANQNSNLMEENEMAKDIYTRDEAAKILNIGKGRVRVLYIAGILKGKDADNLTKASVDARAANVRNIGTRAVLGLGGVGPKEKPAKTAKAVKASGKAKPAKASASKKKDDGVTNSRAVPKPTKTKKAKKVKGEGLPTFENGTVEDQTPTYAPVED